MEMPMLAIKQSKVTRSMLVENSDKEADVAPKSEADSGKGTSFSTSEAEADGRGNKIPLAPEAKRDSESETDSLELDSICNALVSPSFVKARELLWQELAVRVEQVYKLVPTDSDDDNLPGLELLPSPIKEEDEVSYPSFEMVEITSNKGTKRKDKVSSPINVPLLGVCRATEHVGEPEKPPRFDDDFEVTDALADAVKEAAWEAELLRHLETSRVPVNLEVDGSQVELKEPPTLDEIFNGLSVVSSPQTMAVDAEPLNAMASGFDPLYRFRRNLWKGPGIVNRVLVPFWEKIMKSSK